MKTATILSQVNLGDFRLDITKSSDSFNGLLYRFDELVKCFVVGLVEGEKSLIEKANAFVKLSK